MTLLNELKRRKVAQAIFGYLVASAAVLIIIKVLSEDFGASTRIFQASVVAVLMILPFAVWLAWAYDLSRNRWIRLR